MLAVDGPRGAGDVSESIFLQSSVRMFFSLFSVPPVLSFAAPYARSRRLREGRRLLRGDRLGAERAKGKSNQQLNVSSQILHAQIPREVDVETVPDREVVAEQLHGDDVEQTLQAVDRARHADRLASPGDTLVVLVADDDRLRLAGRDLRVRALHLGVQ